MLQTLIHSRDNIHPARKISETELPHYLRPEIQNLISRIKSDVISGQNKTTGIWDPKEKND